MSKKNLMSQKSVKDPVKMFSIREVGKNVPVLSMLMISITGQRFGSIRLSDGERNMRAQQDKKPRLFV